MEGYEIVKDPNLIKKAAASAYGRSFRTGGRLEDALQHLQQHPNDVCMVRLDVDSGADRKVVLLGGPIPSRTLLDVSDHDFSSVADSFDVGEMTSLVEQWFKKDFGKTVTVKILESGDMIHGLGKNSKLISLSRKTPALLDMAATEDTTVIGQYSTKTLGHTGDCNSVIGGVACLHHEVPIKPSTAPEGTRFYFLVGYSCKPLKAWRDSRVFWIVYDPDQEMCWLVPHDLSHAAVGDTVSATMPLVSHISSRPSDQTISVTHLATPVQASLAAASPLQNHLRAHQEYLQKCLTTAKNVKWDVEVVEKKKEEPTSTGGSETKPSADAPVTPTTNNSADGKIAFFDNACDALFGDLPKCNVPWKRAVSLSPMRGPLKVLASGCCANSRVVVMDAKATSATSEINSVVKQLSGIIFVRSMKDPDIYKLHQTRWDMARAPRTPVLALTPDGCKHLCGPMPPCYEGDDEYPTPVAGAPISEDAVKKLVEFALSEEGDEYFGPLYQDVPSHAVAEQAVVDFCAEMNDKNFTAINGAAEETEDSFSDQDFRRLMEVVNILSVSTANSVERNNLAVRLVKFLRKMSKKTATQDLENNVKLHQHESDLKILKGWTGENLDWAFSNKDVLTELLKGSSVKIETQEGIEVDLALQEKVDGAVKKKKAELERTIRATMTGTANSWKKTFNAVFFPPLEALMRSIGENPRYRNFFPMITGPNMSGVIVRASQSTNKQSVATNPEDVMKIFHKLGATGFVSFTINFLQTWKTKVINEICLLDRPGQGFNDPKTFVPLGNRLEDGPADPAAAYETDVRHQFVLPTFSRLPKLDDDSDEDYDDDDEGFLKQMPVAPAEDDLAEYLLMRKEFMLRDPEEGTKQPMWQYVDWLFHQIKVIHQVPEKQAAPLAMRALGFSIARLMKDNPKPDKQTMEIVSSIIQAINFMSARGDPLSHACIDTLFNMGSTYVPQTKDMERNPWQIEVINILSEAVDYVRPLMSAKEYIQIRANFQRAAANMVKRQIVQKLLDDMQEEVKKNRVSQEDYVAQVNAEFYPAYREVVETIKILLEADASTFELTNELRERIGVLHDTVVIVWAKSMRRCRVGPVREMVKVLKTFSDKGGNNAMAYLVDRKVYLQNLYDQVYHIKYEACDHVLIEEVCKIIKAKTRNPEHEKHEKWLLRVDQAIQDVSGYDEKMEGFAHGNQYKVLPTELILRMLQNLKADPVSDAAVSFDDVKSLLSHVGIVVEKPSDLKVLPDDPDGRKTVFEQLRGAWWMCPEMAVASTAPVNADESIPGVALIAMGAPSPTSSIVATMGDTYHKYKVARLFSGKLQPMRNFIKDNYKFHLEWFEDTIRASGLPQHFDPTLVQKDEMMAIYAVVQRLVHELVQDGSDRGDRARDRVYGEIIAPGTPLPLENGSA
ncbi:expressed unknown protein [Seminavis robusta]|uniref:Uncharacterized protein n=1 Tax=Seminavis robusta TaxID=568900 RepID=A0A9N8HJI1_9STRA|nr:expressed unknown protein [Seminavis robusta]|eukprot:Sro553_g165370.1 n/a (1404) ;mRNA; f:40980-45474